MKGKVIISHFFDELACAQTLGTLLIEFRWHTYLWVIGRPTEYIIMSLQSSRPPGMVDWVKEHFRDFDDLHV